MSVLLDEVLGAGALQLCKAASKLKFREAVQRAMPGRYRGYWLARIHDKLSADVPTSTPADFVGETLMIPEQHFTGQEWDSAVYPGEVVDYDAVALRWRVVFDHGPRRSCVVDARCIRKYGPEGMRLCMRAGGGAPDTQLQDYHGTARDGAVPAWYMHESAATTPPAMQRWHARARAGCGLAVVYGKAGASDLCNCTCSATPETLKHVYLSCPHYTGRRVELLRHVDAWRAVMLRRGVVRSRAEAMAWVHTDLGAPSCGGTARVRRELRQAAWCFWRSTRRHKESLPVPPAALCPCPVLAVAAPASGSAL
jgi:hypothetical protein